MRYESNKPIKSKPPFRQLINQSISERSTMKVYAWLIDLVHRRKNCPTGMISGWIQTVTEHRETIQCMCYVIHTVCSLSTIYGILSIYFIEWIRDQCQSLFDQTYCTILTGAKLSQNTRRPCGHGQKSGTPPSTRVRSTARVPPPGKPHWTRRTGWRSYTSGT